MKSTTNFTKFRWYTRRLGVATASARFGAWTAAPSLPSQPPAPTGMIVRVQMRTRRPAAILAQDFFCLGLRGQKYRNISLTPHPPSQPRAPTGMIARVPRIGKGGRHGRTRTSPTRLAENFCWLGLGAHGGGGRRSLPKARGAAAWRSGRGESRTTIQHAPSGTACARINSSR